MPAPILQRHIPRSSQAVRKTISRTIQLAEFDESIKPVIIDSAFIVIEENKAHANGIAELIKEFTNSQEPYVICDSNGFEITDHDGTRGM